MANLTIYARMLKEAAKRVTDDEIRMFLETLGPEWKERLRRVLNTIEVK